MKNTEQKNDQKLPTNNSGNTKAFDLPQTGKQPQENDRAKLNKEDAGNNGHKKNQGKDQDTRKL